MESKNNDTLMKDKKVLEDWREYFSEFEKNVNIENDINVATSWHENNIFTVFIDRNTGELSSERYSKDEKPSINEFIIKYNKIPILTYMPPSTVTELRKIANKTLNIFNNEIKSKDKQKKLPIFLTEYCGYSNYKGWSIIENKEVFIYDYKAYLDNFAYSEVNNINPDNIIDNDKYVVITPSKNLIAFMGLDLFPDIWEIKQSWDKWYPREKKVSNIKIVPFRYRKIYSNCLKAINKSRKVNLGFDDEFSLLETRLYRFEKLLLLKVANAIIDIEAANLTDSYEKIKNII